MNISTKFSPFLRPPNNVFLTWPSVACWCKLSQWILNKKFNTQKFYKLIILLQQKFLLASSSHENCSSFKTQIKQFFLTDCFWGDLSYKKYSPPTLDLKLTKILHFIITQKPKQLNQLTFEKKSIKNHTKRNSSPFELKVHFDGFLGTTGTPLHGTCENS